jgi:hypothetical protein
MGAGVMAGFGLWGSMFPIDTIKSKIQADSLSKPQFKGLVHCLERSLEVEVSAKLGSWMVFCQTHMPCCCTACAHVLCMWLCDSVQMNSRCTCMLDTHMSLLITLKTACMT